MFSLSKGVYVFSGFMCTALAQYGSIMFMSMSKSSAPPSRTGDFAPTSAYTLLHTAGIDVCFRKNHHEEYDEGIHNLLGPMFLYENIANLG